MVEKVKFLVRMEEVGEHHETHGSPPAKGRKPRASASAGAKAQVSGDLREGEQGAQGRSGGGTKPGSKAGRCLSRGGSRGGSSTSSGRDGIVNVKELNRFQGGFRRRRRGASTGGPGEGFLPGASSFSQWRDHPELNVKVDRASKAAVEKVVAAGGT